MSYPMEIARKPYPSDVSDEEWALVAPYLTLLPEDAKQQEFPLRELFNGLRYIIKTGAQWRAMPHDLPPWAAVYQQAQRWLAAGCFEALLDDLRAVTDNNVEVAFVDQGYTGPHAAEVAAVNDIELIVVKLPEAKKGFVLLPRRWVVERSPAWATRFRRLVRDYEQMLKKLVLLVAGS